MGIWNIKKYLDPKYKFVVFKKPQDDVDDEFWCAVETEQEAIDTVKNETEAYGNNEEFQFGYESI